MTPSSSRTRGVSERIHASIAGVGGVTALARSGIGPLLASPESRLLLTTACEEIAAIALGEGVPLPANAVDRVKWVQSRR